MATTETKANNKYKEKRRERLRVLVRLYKVTWGCVDCGYNEHHAALEFDHLPGSKEASFNSFATLIWTCSTGDLWDEISKCDVVCAICHNIRTWERGRT